MKFQDMEIDRHILVALRAMGIDTPTAIQSRCIPEILGSRECHVFAQAKTGSGKTLAFAIPMLNHVNIKNNHVQALVVAPTRELCKQVASVFKKLSKFKKAKVVEVYGGMPINKQINAIRDGGQIVIATPGRLIDLYTRRQIGFRFVKFVALDEADQLLDMGFLPDISYILLEAMKSRKARLMLFSATLDPRIRHLMDEFTKGTEVIEIYNTEKTRTVDTCKQTYYIVDQNKYGYLVNFLRNEKPPYSIIFTRTKRKAEEIGKRLRREKIARINANHITGNLNQNQREKVIRLFRSKEINCLIATDVVARGMDFPRVSHVLNYDFPDNPEDYVHRIGRTARIGGSDKNYEEGKALSFITTSQIPQLRKTEQYTGVKITKTPLPDLPEYVPKR